MYCNYQTNNQSQRETVCHTSSISHQHLALITFRDMLTKIKDSILYYTPIFKNETQNLGVSRSETLMFYVTQFKVLSTQLNNFISNYSHTFFKRKRHTKNILKTQNKVSTKSIINKFENNIKKNQYKSLPLYIYIKIYLRLKTKKKIETIKNFIKKFQFLKIVEN